MGPFHCQIEQLFCSYLLHLFHFCMIFYCMLLSNLYTVSSPGKLLVHLFLICKLLVAAAMLRALSILRISNQICCSISICMIMWKHFIVKFDTKPSSNTQLHLFLLICTQWPVPLKLVLRGWRRNSKLWLLITRFRYCYKFSPPVNIVWYEIVIYFDLWPAVDDWCLKDMIHWNIMAT